MALPEPSHINPHKINCTTATMVKTHPATRSRKAKSPPPKQTTKKKSTVAKAKPKKGGKKETQKQREAKESAAARGAEAANAVDLNNSVGAFLTHQPGATNNKKAAPLTAPGVAQKKPPPPQQPPASLPSPQVAAVEPVPDSAGPTLESLEHITPGDWEQACLLCRKVADIWGRPKKERNDDASTRAPYKARPDELKFFAGIVGTHLLP